MRTYKSMTREDAIKELKLARREISRWRRKANEATVVSIQGSSRIIELNRDLQQAKVDLGLMTKMRDNERDAAKALRARISSLDQKRIELEQQVYELNLQVDHEKVLRRNMGLARDRSERSLAEERVKVELLRSMIIEQMRRSEEEK